MIRHGKDGKGRLTILPLSLVVPLRQQMTNLLEAGYDIPTVQELLGHADVSITMIYTDVLNRGGNGATSPIDRAE